MSKVIKFDVNLSNPTGIYRPGDVLSGTVSIKVREDIHVNGTSKYQYFYCLAGTHFML